MSGNVHRLPVKHRVLLRHLSDGWAACLWRPGREVCTVFPSRDQALREAKVLAFATCAEIFIMPPGDED